MVAQWFYLFSFWEIISSSQFYHPKSEHANLISSRRLPDMGHVAILQLNLTAFVDEFQFQSHEVVIGLFKYTSRAAWNLVQLRILRKTHLTTNNLKPLGIVNSNTVFSYLCWSLYINFLLIL